MEEDIEKYIGIYDELKKHKQIIANIDTEFFFDFADVLIKGYRELEEKNKQCIKAGDLERAVGFLMNRNDFEEYVPKTKIKDKIEEIKKKYELADEYWQYDYDVDMNTIQVLQELMEDK